MNHNFDWDDIRVFLALARAGTVRGAARQLRLAHGTVSRRLRLLEERVGVALFDRDDRGLALNSAGEEILPVAREVEERMAEVDRRLFGRVEDVAGPVRLSVAETLYLSLLQEPLAAFQRRHPMIELQLETSDSMARLDRREADVVIRITHQPPPHLVGRKVADSPLACFATPAYLAERPPLDRWIGYTYEPAMKPAVPARVAAVCGSGVSAQAMIRQGTGIGLLACYAGDSDPGLRRLPGFMPQPDQQIWVLAHEDVRANPRVRLLLDSLYSIMAELRPVIEGDRPRVA